MEYRTIEYGLRLVDYVNSASPNFVSVKQFSEDTGISYTFARVIQRRLTNAGILQSRQGPYGGIVLHKSFENLRVADIVNCFAPEDEIDRNIPSSSPYWLFWNALRCGRDEALQMSLSTLFVDKPESWHELGEEV